MKANITLSLDLNLIKLLKTEKNYSQIVNGLVSNYFSEAIMDKATEKSNYPNDEPPTSEEEAVLKEVGL